MDIDTCTICLESLDKNSDICFLDCGHPYHKKCAKEWLNIKPLCPLCQKQPASRFIVNNYFLFDMFFKRQYCLEIKDNYIIIHKIISNKNKIVVNPMAFKSYSLLDNDNDNDNMRSDDLDINCKLGKSTFGSVILKFVLLKSDDTK